MNVPIVEAPKHTNVPISQGIIAILALLLSAAEDVTYNIPMWIHLPIHTAAPTKNKICVISVRVSRASPGSSIPLPLAKQTDVKLNTTNKLNIKLIKNLLFFTKSTPFLQIVISNINYVELILFSANPQIILINVGAENIIIAPIKYFMAEPFKSALSFAAEVIYFIPT